MYCSDGFTSWRVHSQATCLVLLYIHTTCAYCCTAMKCVCVCVHVCTCVCFCIHESHAVLFIKLMAFILHCHMDLSLHFNSLAGPQCTCGHNHTHRAQQTASTPTCVNSFQWRLITTVWKAACPVLLAKLCYVFHYCNTGSHHRVIISHFCNHSHVAYNNATRTHARHELIIFNVHDGVHFSLLHIVVISLYCIRYGQHSHTCIYNVYTIKQIKINNTHHTY